ncbi:MAG: hypothetical protein Q9225_007268, partial [Loekoesia sp. 1 TL-2023]
MAEGFTTLTGVASFVDVALRACNVLYDSIRYIKNEPELSQRLRRSIQSAESIVQSLNDFVALHRQQQVSAGLPNFLPDAVNHELNSIKAELDALSALLPSSRSSSQLRRKGKWVLDRKKLAEVIQRLDSHGITLILALQSFAQRNGIRLHEDLLQRLEQIQSQQEDTVKNLKERLDLVSTGLHTDLDVVTQTCENSLPAQENLNAGLESLHRLVSTMHTAASDNFDATRAKFDALEVLLSQMQVGGDYVRSSTVVAAPTEDVLARVFRAELLRVVIPTIKQCFDTFKSNSDSQLDEILRKINGMAQQLGSKSGCHMQDNKNPFPDPLMEVSSALTHSDRDLTDSAASGNLDLTAFVVPKGQNKFRGRYVKQWRRSWIFRWTIGTLWVTVSTTTATRKISPEFRIGEILSPQKAYRVTIDFQATQSLIHSRGLTLSIAMPEDADIMEFASENDVEGIRDLFERGLAAPSDRDETGSTPLM